MKWTVLAYKTDEKGWQKSVHNNAHYYVTCKSREEILEAVVEALENGCDKIFIERIKEVL